MSTPIAIKGTKDGLRLMLAEDSSWEDLIAAVRGQLERGTDFFHGAE
ncbi:MAG: septum site-determining protein MinC, partial [Chloroflexi bacterium]|nr:septum site-determining protein MinC [Chloroflexota bacterium]